LYLVTLSIGLALCGTIACLLPLVFALYTALVITPVGITVLTFVLRLYVVCNWKHPLLCSVPAAAAFVLPFGLRGFASFDSSEAYIMLAVFMAVVIVFGEIGVAVGRLVGRRVHRAAPRRIAAAVSLAVLACIAGGLWGYYKVRGWESTLRAHAFGPAALNADADELRRTVVWPTLDAPIVPGSNVLWCSTFQLAWNELCEQAGGNLGADAESGMVRSLNRTAASRADIDDASCTIVAGRLEDVLGRIPKGDDSSYEQRVKSLSPDAFAAYAKIEVSLPFQWAFERLDEPLPFAGTDVCCFGIEQYLDIQENERRAAQQIDIYYYADHTHFVVELQTRRRDHQLLLACVPPEATLEKTVRSVMGHVARTAREKLEECQDLKVPLVDFDVLRNYHELVPEPLALAMQQVRFRLDERGAYLYSFGLTALGLGRNLVFNRPFLVLLQRRGSARPYFALWVDNDELLIPFATAGGRAGSARAARE